MKLDFFWNFSLKNMELAPIILTQPLYHPISTICTLKLCPVPHQQGVYINLLHEAHRRHRCYFRLDCSQSLPLNRRYNFTCRISYCTLHVE